MPAKKLLKIWVEPEEYDKIAAAAASFGLGISDYIRRRIMPDVEIAWLAALKPMEDFGEDPPEN